MYPIKNASLYFKNLGRSVDNIQKMHGVLVEHYRIIDRSKNKIINTYGASKVSLKSTRFIEKIRDIKILSFPQEMYYTYVQANGELEVYFNEDTLLIGDIIRYPWITGTILEYQVIEPPKTYTEDYYIYRIKSLFNRTDIVTKVIDSSELQGIEKELNILRVENPDTASSGVFIETKLSSIEIEGDNS